MGDGIGYPFAIFCFVFVLFRSEDERLNERIFFSILVFFVFC